MRLLRHTIFTIFTLLLTVSIVAAQNNSCSVLIETALDAVAEICPDSSARNRACYGNINLSAEPQANVTDFTFVAPGDRADVTDIASLDIEPMDLDTGTWGIAMMYIQANLPNTQPGQNVIFLMFGDVEIENAGGIVGETLSATANTGINIRNAPNTENSAVIDGLIPGTAVTATGRNADSTWLRVEYGDPATPDVGWVFGELFTVEGDPNILTIVSNDDLNTINNSQFRPMQSVYFQTGIGTAGCTEAPESGILIQTPEGAGRVTLVMNEIVVTLGSTAYVRAEWGGAFTIEMVEGWGSVIADGQLVFVPAGTRVSVPLDEEGIPNGAPTAPEGYDNDRIARLPVRLLTRVFGVQPALETEQEIATGVQDVIDNPDIDNGGTWRVTYASSGLACPSYGDIIFANATGTVTFGNGTISTDFGGWVGDNYTSAGGGAYTFSFSDAPSTTEAGIEYNGTLRVISDTQLTGEFSARIYDRGFSCPFNSSFTLTRLNE